MAAVTGMTAMTRVSRYDAGEVGVGMGATLCCWGVAPYFLVVPPKLCLTWPNNYVIVPPSNHENINQRIDVAVVAGEIFDVLLGVFLSLVCRNNGGIDCSLHSGYFAPGCIHNLAKTQKQ